LATPPIEIGSVALGVGTVVALEPFERIAQAKGARSDVCHRKHSSNWLIFGPQFRD
jgi:hypothetical protein